MNDTSEINKILGELQQEIQYLRDSELKHLVEPFAQKIELLVNKIDSVDFPSRLNMIDKNLNDVNSNVVKHENAFLVLNKKLDELNIFFTKKFDYVEKKVKLNYLFLIISMILILISIVLNFMK